VVSQPDSRLLRRQQSKTESRSNNPFANLLRLYLIPSRRRWGVQKDTFSSRYNQESLARLETDRQIRTRAKHLMCLPSIPHVLPCGVNRIGIPQSRVSHQEFSGVKIVVVACSNYESCKENTMQVRRRKGSLSLAGINTLIRRKEHQTYSLPCNSGTPIVPGHRLCIGIICTSSFDARRGRSADALLERSTSCRVESVSIRLRM